MIKILAIPLIILATICSRAQSLEFFRQDMVFEIKNDYFYVDGNYFLCNVGNNIADKNLFYPFPSDISYGKVDSVKIVNLETSEQIKFYRNKEMGLYFEVKLNPYSVGKYKIKYRQKLYGNKAEYILITAQAWNKPLEIAYFKLMVPENIKITSISYKTDSVYSSQNKEIYVWKIKDFVPKQNMVIKFNKD